MFYELIYSSNTDGPRYSLGFFKTIADISDIIESHDRNGTLVSACPYPIDTEILTIRSHKFWFSKPKTEIEHTRKCDENGKWKTFSITLYK